MIQEFPVDVHCKAFAINQVSRSSLVASDHQPSYNPMLTIIYATECHWLIYNQNTSDIAIKYSVVYTKHTPKTQLKGILHDFSKENVGILNIDLIPDVKVTA